MREVALARIDILEGRSAAEKAALVQAVRAALSEALRAPEDDPAARLSEYPPGHFALPYPDRHSELFTLIEVTMFAGRSMEAKQRLYDTIVRRLAALGTPPSDVLIVLHEPRMENWALDGGIPASETDLGFEVDI